MAERVMLKKYASRRLYDTEKSTYVTLGEVADMIKEGRRVDVVDAKTNEDVTAFILTQIVLEEAKTKNLLLPVPLLHLFIRYGDNVLSEFFEKYLQHVLKNYLTYKNMFDEQFAKWLDMGVGFSDLAQKSIDSFSPFRSYFDLFNESRDSGNKEKSSPQ